VQSYKYISIMALSILGIIVFAGCSEDPESKAAREARAACEKAISIMQSTGDVEKARAALARVQLSQLRGKDVAALVAMVKGSMLLEEANTKAQGVAEAGSFKAGLTMLANRQADAMGPLAAKLYEYKRLNDDKVRIRKNVEGTMESLTQLKLALAGNNGDGLETQLSASQTEVASLRKEMSDWEAKADAAIEEANKLQADAQDLSNKADLATGEEREQLKQKSYDLLLGKGGGQSKEAILVKAQAAMDQVSLVESKMKLAQARVGKLGKSVQEMKDSIAGLEKTVSSEQLNSSVDAISSRQSKLTSEIGSQLSEIEKAGGEYSALSDEVAGLYDKACVEFATAAGSRSGTPGVAKFALADCKYRGGMTMSGVSGANENLGLRAKELAKNAVDEYAVKKLGEIVSGHADRQKAALAAAIKMLGEACESYKGVTGVGKPAKCAALSSNVMAYLEMLGLAGKADDKAAMTGMAEELRSLGERGKECDEKFADTPAGKMLAAAMKAAGVPIEAPAEAPKVETPKAAEPANSPAEAPKAQPVPEAAAPKEAPAPAEPNAIAPKEAPVAAEPNTSVAARAEPNNATK
jgi:predicted  nucleic acid-binding Zn-ribbon protein